MSNNLSFPGDLYFWGQDRLGSFIPLTGSLLLKLTGIKAITAVSLSQYFILIVGFFCISTLFKRMEVKLLLAILWFLPPLIFLDYILLAQPYGVQISLLAVAIFLFNKINSGVANTYFQHFYIFLLSMALLISWWVSDIAVVSIFMFAIIGLFSYLKIESDESYIRIKRKKIFKEPALYHILIWLSFGVVFIFYAKSTAVTDSRYSNQPFNDLSSIIEALSISFAQITDIFTFKYESNIFLGLFSWITLSFILFILIYRKKYSDKTTHEKWMYYFLIHGITVLVLVFISKWVLLNGMSRRYFVMPYISFALAFLLYLDKKNTKSIILQIGIILLGLSSLLSAVAPLYFPQKLNSRYEEIKEFDQLGNAGIISEYWNSYISSVSNPNNLIATPHDSAYIRNHEIAEAVFRQPKIYIIKDLWFTEFPEAMEQFDHFLKKSGEPFLLGGSVLCEYKLSKLYMTFNVHDLKSANGKIITDTNTISGEAIVASRETKESYMIFGPYIDLPKGEYKIIFRLSTDNITDEQKLGIIDVASNWGKTKHCSMEIKTGDFDVCNQYQDFEMFFNSATPIQHVEFRIYYTGNSNLSFSSIELMQL